jgi:hypothetical protein
MAKMIRMIPSSGVTSREGTGLFRPVNPGRDFGGGKHGVEGQHGALRGKTDSLSGVIKYRLIVGLVPFLVSFSTLELYYIYTKNRCLHTDRLCTSVTH